MLLRARWVVPVATPPIADGVLAIVEGRVRWVGPHGASDRPAGEIHDLGDGILLPGLVNAHCHLELSHLRALWRRTDGFVGWVEALVSGRAAAEPGTVRDAVRAALGEAEGFGTALMGDVTNLGAHADLLAASQLGGVAFLELLGWDPATAERTVAEGREGVRRLAHRLAGSEWRGQLAAHAPHSVSPAALRTLAGTGELGSVHVAETAEEATFVRDGSGAWAGFLARRGLGHVPWRGAGTSVVQYLDEIEALGPGSLAVHCVQVARSDVEILRRRRVTPVLCPRSNRNLGAGRPPLPLMLEAGLRPALGTDSLASVEDLDVLGEAALLHAEYPDIPPGVLLEMATVNGAQALGREGVGTLRPGDRALLAFAPCAADVEDPVAMLVSGHVRARRVPEVEG